jgi:hypothetical protein
METSKVMSLLPGSLCMLHEDSAQVKTVDTETNKIVRHLPSSLCSLQRVLSRSSADTEASKVMRLLPGSLCLLHEDPV